MLRRMSFDRRSLSPFLISSSFAVPAPRRPLPRLLSASLSRGRQQPQRLVHPPRPASSLVLFQPPSYRPPPRVLSPLAKFFSSLAVSSFYRELRSPYPRPIFDFPVRPAASPKHSASPRGFQLPVSINYAALHLASRSLAPPPARPWDFYFAPPPSTIFIYYSLLRILLLALYPRVCDSALIARARVFPPAHGRASSSF